MANLSFLDRKKLEDIFDMKRGYVLDFTNSKFSDFIADVAGKNIYDDRYSEKGDSKAKRLRAFWELESDEVVAKVNSNLLEYWLDRARAGHFNFDEDLWKECKAIIEKMPSTQELDIPIKSKLEKDFDFRIANLRESIASYMEKDQPEMALDRVHTYMTNYSRMLCDRHGVEHTKQDPLHSLFGKYVKELQRSNRVSSEMTIKILKQSISVLDLFNPVRNDSSLAHDNELLNYAESKLIVRSVLTIIDFVENIEAEYFADLYADMDYDAMRDDADLPF